MLNGGVVGRFFNFGLVFFFREAQYRFSMVGFGSPWHTEFLMGVSCFLLGGGGAGTGLFVVSLGLWPLAGTCIAQVGCVSSVCT